MTSSLFNQVVNLVFNVHFFSLMNFLPPKLVTNPFNHYFCSRIKLHLPCIFSLFLNDLHNLLLFHDPRKLALSIVLLQIVFTSIWLSVLIKNILSIMISNALLFPLWWTYEAFNLFFVSLFIRMRFRILVLLLLLLFNEFGVQEFEANEWVIDKSF